MAILPMKLKFNERFVSWVLVAGLALSFSAHAEDLSYTVKGLALPAEIIVDTWGVPHIYAQTHYDAFFVQGFNAARDRLWQIDLWRRRGLGEILAVLRRPQLQQDKKDRFFLYHGGIDREVK